MKMYKIPRIIILYFAAIAIAITIATISSNPNSHALAEINSSQVQVKLSADKQIAGGSLIVNATGLAPETYTEVIVDDGVEASSFAYLKSDHTGQLYFTIYSPDTYLDKETTFDEDGNIIDSINEEHTYEGPVKVIVRDDAGNVGTADLEVIRESS